MSKPILSPQVPVMNANIRPAERESMVSSLREISCNRLWIAWERSELFSKDRRESIKSLEANVRYFQQAGFEVGVWIQAYGFGDPLSYEDCSWTRLRSVTGKEREADALCPEDPEFLAQYCSWVSDVASVSPELIMLDDDLCLSVRPGIGCFCQRHLALLERELGEALQLNQCADLFFTGGPNRYRDAWFRVMGESNRNFCRAVRKAVDAINPSIRVGFCAGYTSWDMEGTDPIELSRILAGNTRPFFRFTGAPYWASRISNRFPGQKLNGVIECARNQAAWSQDTEIEYFAEADSFPRPCYHVNASYIENFDLAMRAQGVPSLKYLADYFSDWEYETQYFRLHRRNMPYYPVIRQAFEGTDFCGVRLYRPAHRILEADLPTPFQTEKGVMRTFFSVGASALTRMSIPVCYDGASSCALAFGDDAKFLTDPSVHQKIVLDLPAALILQEKGVDLGILEVNPTAAPVRECFGERRLLLSAVGKDTPFTNGGFFSLGLKPEAKVLSVWEQPEGIVPSSYCYESGGVSYLILCFDALYAGEASTLLCSYARQESLLAFFGSPYPVIPNRSQVYTMCANSSKGQVSLFQNLSIDPYFDFSIDLPCPCSSFRLIGGEGVLAEDRRSLKITTDFHPSSFLLLETIYE